jgi:hypothetical protein
MNSKTYRAPHYAVLSSLLLSLPHMQIFFSAPCLQTTLISLRVKDQLLQPYKTQARYSQIEYEPFLRLTFTRMNTEFLPAFEKK